MSDLPCEPLPPEQLPEPSDDVLAEQPREVCRETVVERAEVTADLWRADDEFTVRIAAHFKLEKGGRRDGPSVSLKLRLELGEAAYPQDGAPDDGCNTMELKDDCATDASKVELDCASYEAKPSDAAPSVDVSLELDLPEVGEELRTECPIAHALKHGLAGDSVARVELSDPAPPREENARDDLARSSGDGD